eukprot:1303564-Rhodomonas_salina.1
MIHTHFSYEPQSSGAATSTLPPSSSPRNFFVSSPRNFLVKYQPYPPFRACYAVSGTEIQRPTALFVCAMQYPVLRYMHCFRACYAVSGTEIQGPIVLC